MAQYDDINVPIASLEETLEMQEAEANYLMDRPEMEDETEYEELAGHIISEFSKNRDARRDSGIEEEMINSIRAYNAEYSAEDKNRIAQVRGSQIYMNITATKSRAAKSWIADIMRPPTGEPWSIEPTPMEDLPEETKALIKKSVDEEFQKAAQPPPQPPQQPQQGAPPQQGQQQPPQPQQGQGGPPPIEKAQETIRETNQKRRDISDAITEEMTLESRHSLKKMERKIADQLAEGGWDKALIDFIDDFCIFPTAFMKAPVITKKKGLTWQGGQPVVSDVYRYENHRVSCFDIYPSPAATEVTDGNFCEHMRFTRADIDKMKGQNYIDEALVKILEECEVGQIGSWLDHDIEEEKEDQENKDTNRADSDVIHGIHFWGCLSVKQLTDWGYESKLEDIDTEDETKIVEIEALLIGNHVVKCAVNKDPLGRRPYLKASFMNVPGSFWGKSLPTIMDSSARMCNAAARALSNNLGVASGPQIVVDTQRLADDGDIEEITPFKIWQTKSDPTGGQGKAIDFFQPTSNSNELLGVYNTFEEKADDVTGIPKYAYGNERTAGAAQTAQGLAMLLESTSKIIKDCIRNIDEGLIKKRIKAQFYENMISDEGFEYTGDINVVTIGSGTLSIRGAEATRRNEFLMATANPTDMAVLGTEGRAAILREMATDLGLSSNIVPSTFEVKQKQKKMEESQAQAAQATAQLEEKKINAGIQATTVQIEGQKAMHEVTMQKEIAKIKADMQKHQEKLQVQMADLKRKMQEAHGKNAVAMTAEDGKGKRQNQEIALKLKSDDGKGI